MNITDLQPTHTREVQNHYKFHQTANGILWQPIVKQVAHLWNESAQNDAAKRTVRSVPKLPNFQTPRTQTWARSMIRACSQSRVVLNK